MGGFEEMRLLNPPLGGQGGKKEGGKKANEVSS
jgi:hypothetical protein